MKKYEFNNFLYYVNLLKKIYTNMLGKKAVMFNLTLPEADVLSFLYEYKDFDKAKDIAKYREVSKAYVSDAVYKLVEKRYLTISIDKEDRRIQHLKIAGSAKKIAEELQNTQQDFYKSIMAHLTENEIKNLLLAVEKCAAGICDEFKRLKLENKKDK